MLQQEISTLFAHKRQVCCHYAIHKRCTDEHLHVACICLRERHIVREKQRVAQLTDFLQPFALLGVGFYVCHRFGYSLQTVRAHFVRHADTSLLQESSYTTHQVIIALNSGLPWLAAAHHGKHTEHGHALFLHFDAHQHHELRSFANCCAYLLQKAYGAAVAVGNGINIWRTEFFFKIFGSGKAFIAQHNIYLCLAHSLQLVYAGVAAKAGITTQVQSLIQQALYLPDVASHAVAPRRGADDVVHARLLHCILLWQVSHEQLVGFRQADAVITAEAALLEGHKLSLDLVLHITAHALDVSSDDGSYGGGYDEDNLRRIAFIQFDNCFLQTCYVAHDNIVLAHMRGEEAVLKTQAQASV